MNKLTLNMIRLTHSITATLLSYLYIKYHSEIIKNILFLTSYTYFLLDIYTLSDNLDKLHHILTSLLLLLFCLEYYESLLIKLFYYGELSNIILFVNYHIIKTNNNYNIILISNILEFIIYTYCRVYKFTFLLINNYDIILFTPLILLLFIYYMSIDWSYTLFINLLKIISIKRQYKKKII